MTQRIPATLFPATASAPIVDATLAVLDALARLRLGYQVRPAGRRQERRRPAAAALDSIRRTRLALKGPLETPSGGGYRSSNVRLREEFKLYANLRPARTIGARRRFDNIDLVVVRENLEGLYIGHEHYVRDRRRPARGGHGHRHQHRAGCRRILSARSSTPSPPAARRSRSVHKANIMKALTGIFLETGRADVRGSSRAASRWTRVIVDACAMKLVLNPGSSTCWSPPTCSATSCPTWCGLVGGLGMAPGANIGADAAIFEAVHGSAPDIAAAVHGNPSGLLLAAAMMLEHVQRGDLARLRQAIDDTLNIDQVRTETPAAVQHRRSSRVR